LQFPFTEEGDPLGQKLWQATGGRVRFKQFQMDNLRKLQFSDEEVLVKFSEFWETEGKTLAVQDVSRHFFMALKAAA
jgi:hypothetical protein